MKAIKLKGAISMLLIAVMILATSSISFAMGENQKEYTFEEAKNYLENYSDEGENVLGQKVTTIYQFESEEQLNEAATYIVDYGLDAFNEKLQKGIESVLKEEESKRIQTRETSPMSITKKVSGNKTHSIKGEASGYVTFKTLGSGEYLVSLSYKLVAQNGKFTRLASGPTLSFSGMSGGLSVGNTSTPHSNLGTTKFTANAKYDIVKTVNVGWIQVKEEIDTEVFGVTTYLV